MPPVDNMQCRNHWAQSHRELTIALHSKYTLQYNAEIVLGTFQAKFPEKNAQCRMA